MSALSFHTNFHIVHSSNDMMPRSLESFGVHMVMQQPVRFPFHLLLGPWLHLEHKAMHNFSPTSIGWAILPGPQLFPAYPFA